jgi:hypothetical protein
VSDIDIIADAREWLATQGDRVQTHGDKCHRWHPACLVARLVREVERHREAIRRLADQDATLSVVGGNVIVEIDAALTDAEREAIENCIYASVRIGDDWSDKQAATLRGLLDRTSQNRIVKDTKNVVSPICDGSTEGGGNR